MPTATYPLGAGVHFTSGANDGVGFGTAAYTTTNGAYNPTANRLLIVIVGGLTNNAGTLTGPSFSSTVGSGSNPTWTQHPAGWLSATASGWCPFVTAFAAEIGGTAPTNLRFVCDATDSIYQWFVLPIEVEDYDPDDWWGPWGSDTANADTADNEVTTLDENTSPGIGEDDIVIAALSADGNAGNTVAPGTGWTERMESAAGGGATIFQVQDDQTSPDNTAEWGAIGNTVFSWITFAFAVRHEPDAGGEEVEGTASLSFGFSLGVSGQREVEGATAISSTFTLAAEGERTVKGTAAASPAFALAATGQREVEGTASIASTLSLTAEGERTVEGLASIAPTFSLTGEGLREVEGTAAISPAFTLTVTIGAQEREGIASFNLGGLSLTAQGERTVTGAAALAFVFALAAIAEGAEPERLPAFVRRYTQGNFTTTARVRHTTRAVDKFTTRGRRT